MDELKAICIVAKVNVMIFKQIGNALEYVTSNRGAENECIYISRFLLIASDVFGVTLNDLSVSKIVINFVLKKMHQLARN